MPKSSHFSGQQYINIKPIRILKHGRKAKSLVKYGLKEISTILLRPTYTPKFDKILNSRRLTLRFLQS